MHCVDRAFAQKCKDWSKALNWPPPAGGVMRDSWIRLHALVLNGIPHWVTETDLGKSVRGGRMTAFMQGKGPAVLAVMDEIAAETGATLAQIALAWLATQPGVTAPIASATSVAQVEELAGSLNLALSSEQRDRLTVAGA